MAVSLQTLISQLPQNLSDQILTPEQSQARVQQQVAAMAPEILRQYGQTAQQQNEAAFGKGMGLSTWNAYQQALNTLMQNEAIGKLGIESQNAVDAAQRAAVGNAANYASSEMNRQAQAQQARAQRNQATSLQNRSMIYQGLGGLAGGGLGLLGRTFQPEIQKGLRGLAGLGGGKPETEPNPSIGAGTGPLPSENAVPSPDYPSLGGNMGFSLEPGGGVSAPDIGSSGYNYGGTDYTDFNWPDLSLGGLLQTTFDPQWDWSFS